MQWYWYMFREWVKKDWKSPRREEVLEWIDKHVFGKEIRHEPSKDVRPDARELSQETAT